MNATTKSPETVDALNEVLAHSSPDDPTNPWHELWYTSLRDRALPALIADDVITPGASLWTGSRLWTQAFRSAGLTAGDRIVLALPPSPVFVQVLVAALWDSLSVALLPPNGDSDHALHALDARAAVVPDHHPHGWTPDGCSGPRTTPDALRTALRDRTPDVRFLLQTSGTTGSSAWVALSDRNVLSVLASHLLLLRLNEARMLSVLPWSHAFGLVLDLLPALLAGTEVIRDPDGGRSPETLLSLHDAWGTTHLNAVPLTIERLLTHERGTAFLSDLQGGIVGGAAVSDSLAQSLSETRLRVGYGQTEASPGITLGARGDWAANSLGTAVGCEVDVTETGELRFRGPNACLGIWRKGELHRADPDRWVYTGDLVEREGSRFYYRGRTDDAFNLPNGRLVHPHVVENRLKQAFDDLRDALVYTCDDLDVGVALCLNEEATVPPSEDSIRECLGPLAPWLDCIHLLPPDTWRSMPTGETDRHATRQPLTGPMDACYVNDEQARAQEGSCYGGWITDDVGAPLKEAPERSAGD